MPLRRLVIAMLAALGAALAAGPAAVAGPPNVVIVQTDDQTAESMHVMERTRALIGAEGTTFRNSFASLAQCCPSRATLLTGRYAHNHGVLDMKPPWGGYARLDHAETLAAWLQRAGYATVFLGKYLNGYGNRDPLEVPGGWTEWHGLVDPSTYSYYRYTFNDDGELTRFGSRPEDYQTDVITGRATEIIARRAKEDAPFFLWTSYLAPHNGLPREPGDPAGMATPVAALRHRNVFDGLSPRLPPSFDEADVSDKPLAIRRRPLLSWRTMDAIDEHHRQQLESLLAVDEGVERIVAALGRSGELGNTIVLFTSDNGFLHGEHRVPGGKVLPYEPSIRVPLLIRGPGAPRGLELGQLAANVDIAPTLLEAAGVPAGLPPDGTSLFAFMRDPELETGRDILIESTPRRDGTPRFAGLRTRGRLYVERDSGERELYDLARDPHQLRSVHADEAAAPLRSALARRLADLRTCAGTGCSARPRLGLALTPDRRQSAIAACTVVVRVTGRAARRVASTRFTVDGRAVGGRRRPPFAVRVPGAGTVRARVALADDRVVTLDRRLPGCG